MSALKRKIIVIEDDPPIRRFLHTALDAHGYEVIESAAGRQGIIEAKNRKADLIILDLGLPDLDGVEVVKAVRAWSDMPILILSARSAEAQKIEALDAGADDYLTKPFGLGELLARIRVALRHASVPLDQTEAGVFVTGGLKVDLLNRRVYREGREIHLTPVQYRLLAVLVRHAGKIMTHRQLLKEVWGPNCIESPHYLRIYMSQLRHKLEADPAQPCYLLTETGVGYWLKVQG